MSKFVHGDNEQEELEDIPTLEVLEDTDNHRLVVDEVIGFLGRNWPRVKSNFSSLE